MLLFVMLAAQVGQAEPKCSVADRPVAKRISELSPNVLKSISQVIANPDEPFRVSDVETAGQKNRPLIRLICGYETPNGYVVERELGGRGYSIGKIVFRKAGSGFGTER